VGRSTNESSLQHAKSQVPDPANDTTVAVPVSSQPSLPSVMPIRPFWVKPLLWNVVFILTAGVSAAVGATLMLTTSLPNALAPHHPKEGEFTLNNLWQKGFGYRITRPVNILVMGIDRVLDTSEKAPDIFSGRSDTMLLVRLDPAAETVNVLSIPRDTRVDIPGIGIYKINHANVVGGAMLAAQTVSYNLDGITIDRYVRVSTGAFRELVDLLGGVEIFVPTRMYYIDKTQDLRIDLQPGRQVLNGDQAEQFARFRKDGFGDVGRVQRQQQLIRALRDRLTNPLVLPKLPQAIELLQSYIDTNLTLNEMLALASFGLGLKQDNFRMVMLPGRFSTPAEYIASYWIMDRDRRDQIMQNYFKVDSLNLAAQQRDVNSLRIAVQNASGNPRLGRQVVTYLLNHGFRDVYVTRDWPDHQAETQIIAQQGDLQSAASLESFLGLGHVVASSTGDLESDLTIRVGSDWIKHLEGL